MSGHSKWSTIKRKKAIEDGKRGKDFTKLAKAITVAVRKGNSGDPELNSFLRLAVEKAKQSNLPKDKIQAAIDRALGTGSENLIEISYEAYVYGGVGLIIHCGTDNKNRSINEVKAVLSKHNCVLGTPNSVAYIFNESGDPSFTIPVQESDIEGFELLIQDLEALDDVIELVHNAD